MTIEITLTTEQSDALNGVITAANAGLAEGATPYTPETYLTMLLTKAVESYAKTAYEASLRRLGEGAAALPYEARLALIAKVEAQIAP